MEDKFLSFSDNIVSDVKSKIQNHNYGILHQALHIILEKEQAEEICSEFDIQENASLDEDEKLVAKFIAKQNPLISSGWDLGKTLDNVIKPEMDKLRWAVLIAGTLYGIWYFNKIIANRKAKSRPERNIKPQTLPVLSEPSILHTQKVAALCIIVPTSSIVELKSTHQNGLEDNRLSLSELESLIDSASYFLCTTIDDADIRQSVLDTTPEEILNSSKRDVYIRVHIDNGQEMIGKNILYIIKRNLPVNGQRIVQRYNYLKSLKGLEAFNRV